MFFGYNKYHVQLACKTTVVSSSGALYSAISATTEVSGTHQ